MERGGIQGDHGMGVIGEGKRDVSRWGEDIWIYHKEHPNQERAGQKSYRGREVPSDDPWAKPCRETFPRKGVRCHNRQIHKAAILQGGVRTQNQVPKTIHGFQFFDKVLCAGEEGFLFERRTNGYFDVRKLDGTKISAGISYRKGKLLETRKTL